MTNDEKQEIECACCMLHIDGASKEDELPSQGHNMAAQALARWLTNEQGANSIALEGGLGSGKSTVVKLAYNTLKLKDNYWFIEFDLFQHQHKSVRRAFLEYLIDSIIEDSTNADRIKKLTEIRKYVTGRKTIVDTTQKIKIQPLGILITLAIAIATALISSVSRVLVSATHKPDWPYIIGCLVLIGLPVLIVGIAAFCNRDDDDWSWTQLFAKETDGSKTDEYLTAPEVTEIELIKYFKEIVELVPNERPLTIVFDNIDRVPPEEILGTWRHLDIFITQVNKLHKEDDNTKNLKIIVPYDLDRLSLAFENDAHENEDYDARQLALEYINKRFPIRIPVPKMLITDWREFFTTKWQKCNGEEEDGQTIKDILTIFDQMRLDYEITPRHIKQFCNDLGVMLDINQTRNPILATFYIIAILYNGHSIESVVLADSELPGPAGITPLTRRTLENYTDRWREEIAAMHYNSTPERAIEILIDTPVQRAIEREDQEAYLTLSKSHGFNWALEKAIAKYADIEKPQIMLDAIFRLQANIESQPQSTEASIWRAVRPSLDKWEPWASTHNQLTAYERVLSAENYQTMIKKLIRQFESIAETDEPTYWLYAIDQLEEASGDSNIYFIPSDALIESYFSDVDEFPNLSLNSFAETSKDAWILGYAQRFQKAAETSDGIAEIRHSDFRNFQSIIIQKKKDINTLNKTHATVAQITTNIWERLSAVINPATLENLDINENDIIMLSVIDNRADIRNFAYLNLIAEMLTSLESHSTEEYWVAYLIRRNALNDIDDKHDGFADIHTEALKRIVDSETFNWIEWLEFTTTYKTIVDLHNYSVQEDKPYHSVLADLFRELVKSNKRKKIHSEDVVDNYHKWKKTAQAGGLSTTDLWQWFTSIPLKVDDKISMDSSKELLKDIWQERQDLRNTLVDLLLNYFDDEDLSDDDSYARWLSPTKGALALLVLAHEEIKKDHYKSLLKVFPRFIDDILSGEKTYNPGSKGYIAASLYILHNLSLKPVLKKCAAKIYAAARDESLLPNCTQAILVLDEDLPEIEISNAEQASFFDEVLSTASTCDNEHKAFIDWVGGSADSIAKYDWSDNHDQLEDIQGQLQVIANKSLMDENLLPLKPLWEKFSIAPQEQQVETEMEETDAEKEPTAE